jgi:hypothetical protein
MKEQLHSIPGSLQWGRPPRAAAPAPPGYGPPWLPGAGGCRHPARASTAQRTVSEKRERLHMCLAARCSATSPECTPIKVQSARVRMGALSVLCVSSPWGADRGSFQPFRMRRCVCLLGTLCLMCTWLAALLTLAPCFSSSFTGCRRPSLAAANNASPSS